MSLESVSVSSTSLFCFIILQIWCEATAKLKFMTLPAEFPVAFFSHPYSKLSSNSFWKPGFSQARLKSPGQHDLAQDEVTLIILLPEDFQIHNIQSVRIFLLTLSVNNIIGQQQSSCSAPVFTPSSSRIGQYHSALWLDYRGGTKSLFCKSLALF